MSENELSPTTDSGSASRSEPTDQPPSGTVATDFTPPLGRFTLDSSLLTSTPVVVPRAFRRFHAMLREGNLQAGFQIVVGRRSGRLKDKIFSAINGERLTRQMYEIMLENEAAFRLANMRFKSSVTDKVANVAIEFFLGETDRD